MTLTPNEQPLYTQLIMKLSSTYVKNGNIIKSRNGGREAIFLEINTCNNIVYESEGIVDIFCQKDIKEAYQKIIDNLAQTHGPEIRDKIRITCR